MKINYRFYRLPELSLYIETTSREFDGQREYKPWKREEELKLLETIYLEYPMPSFFIGRDTFGNTYLIDGQHRYKTINKIKSEILKNYGADEKLKSELKEIFLERLNKTAYDFIKQDYKKIVKKLISYVANVTIIDFKDQDEINLKGLSIFNYLNSTRNDIPDGIIVSNELKLAGMKKQKIQNINKGTSEIIKYTATKTKDMIPLLDVVRSFFFSTQKQKTPQGGKNYGIPETVNKRIREDKDFKEKLKKFLESSFLKSFLDNAKREEIGYNKSNNPRNVVSSTYIYPALAISIIKDDPKYINKEIWNKYLTIVDELLNKEAYKNAKSAVFGTVKRTVTSLIIIERLKNETINSTDEFFDKYFK